MTTLRLIFSNLRQLILIFLYVAAFTFTANSQSKTISNLVKAKVHDTQLYFYPSTLRMLNINKDPAFYALVENVKHLRILTFASDSLVGPGGSAMVKALEGEGFEEAMSMRSQGANVRIYSKSPSEKMEGLVAFVAQDDQNFVLELEGEVNPLKLYDLLQNGLDMPVLDSYFKNKADEEARGEKYREFRESLQEEEKAKTDSLATQDTIKQ